MFDRTWRDNQENPLENDKLTRWEKFKTGGYSVKNIGSSTSKSLMLKQKKCEYLS